jgi:oxygen-dependent protoporphyrinogen oxidase
MPEVAVVGAGMAGLAAALRLQDLLPDAAITVFEAAGRVGGVVSSDPAPPDSVALEGGPDSLLARKPAGVALVRRVGLESSLMGSNPRARGALIYHGGRLHPIPAGVIAGVPMHPDRLRPGGILSAQGVRAVEANLAWAPESVEGDVSLGDFLAARLGREWVDRVAAPILSGIYAGNIYRLSLRATYPELAHVASTYGSLSRGMAAERAKAPPAPGPVFVTLVGGLGRLPGRVAEVLAADVRLGHRVEGVSAAGPGRYRIWGDGFDHEVDGVVVAAPAPAAARMLAPLAPEVARDLATVPYANLAVVSAHFPAGAFKVPDNMTGILVPAGSSVAMTALTFVAEKWAHPDPPADIPIRVFYGRADGEDVVAWSDGRFLGQMQRDLEAVLGPVSAPTAAVIHRHPAGMPQYTVGHAERIGRTAARLQHHPAIRLAGAAYHGVGIPDVVHDGYRAAELVAAAITSASDTRSTRSR